MNTRRIRLLVSVVLGVLAMGLSAWGMAASSKASVTAGASTGSVAAQPIHLQVDYDRLPFDTPSRMCSAILVVDGTVARLGAGHWNTTDRQRPATADTLRVETRGYQIYTPMQVIGLRTILDHRRQLTRELVEVGGHAGADSIHQDGFAQPRAGRRYLMVFVPGQIAEATTPDFATLMLVDAFAIDSNGNISMPSSGQLNASGRDIGLNSKPVALGDIESQLASCK